MKAVVIYESLTGKTRRAGELIGDLLAEAGAETTVCPIDRIDYAALAAADLVVVGTWTDGLVFVGQRPGRAGRMSKLLPVMRGKRAAVFCTYAIDCGHTLDKLTRLVQDHGADVVGGMAIRRDRMDTAVPDFVDRVLGLVEESSTPA